jgi:SHS2 domain-containing protein
MQNKGFRILDHPADLGVEAFGSNLAEAFEQAAVALMSIILELSTVRELQTRTIELSAGDHGHLLVKWLTEVLYLYDGEGFVAGRFKIGRLTPTHLDAKVYGELFYPERHITKLDVKAITYHQLEVNENANAARVKAFFDI